MDAYRQLMVWQLACEQGRSIAYFLTQVLKTYYIPPFGRYTVPRTGAVWLAYGEEAAFWDV